ncbi:hypothetical protein EJ110_NYTH44255 [Nymphaea thermarum]|nr:hypothetical protein EJ110_NYTH44255 [Nymphaea thermarum]
MATCSKPQFEKDCEEISDEDSEKTGQRSEKKRGQKYNEPRSNLRVDFPRFDGKDAQDWVIKAEQYFECQEVREDKKITTTMIYFEGAAMRWYRWYKRKNPVMVWETFSNAILARFGVSSFTNYHVELINLKQIATVEEFQSRFEDLSFMVGDWPEPALLGAFMSGLKEGIRIEMLSQEHVDLDTCFAKAPLRRLKNELAIDTHDCQNQNWIMDHFVELNPDHGPAFPQYFAIMKSGQNDLTESWTIRVDRMEHLRLLESCMGKSCILEAKWSQWKPSTIKLTPKEGGNSSPHVSVSNRYEGPRRKHEARIAWQPTGRMRKVVVPVVLFSDFWTPTKAKSRHSRVDRWQQNCVATYSDNISIHSVQHDRGIEA